MSSWLRLLQNVNVPGLRCSPAHPSGARAQPSWSPPWSLRRTRAGTDGTSGPPRTHLPRAPGTPCPSASWRARKRIRIENNHGFVDGLKEEILSFLWFPSPPLPFMIMIKIIMPQPWFLSALFQLVHHLDHHYHCLARQAATIYIYCVYIQYIYYIDYTIYYTILYILLYIYYIYIYIQRWNLALARSPVATERSIGWGKMGQQIILLAS